MYLKRLKAFFLRIMNFQTARLGSADRSGVTMENTLYRFSSFRKCEAFDTDIPGRRTVQERLGSIPVLAASKHNEGERARFGHRDFILLYN